MRINRFVLTEDHIKLLRRMCVGWDDCETGAPAIDPKRPYGNSSVNDDIHEILTGEHINRGEDTRGNLTEEEDEKYSKLHKETQEALQIVLHTGKFEPGTYERGEYGIDWKRVK